MRLLSGLISLLLVCFGYSGWAQTYSGSYMLNTPEGSFKIQLSQDGLQVRGTLSILDGTIYQVQAQVQDGEAAVGFVTSTQSKEYFEAFVEDDTLYVTLADWNNATGEPVWESEVEFEFARSGAAAAPGRLPRNPTPSADVSQPYRPAPAAQPGTPAPAPALPPTPERNLATLTPGQQYNAGTRVQSPGDGVSFVIPQDWLGGLRPNQAAFMLGSNTKPGIGLVIMRASASMADMDGLLNTAQNLGDGVVLYPAGAPQKTATDYRLNFSGGQYVGMAVGKLGPGGNGVIFFFGGPAEQQSYYNRLMQQMVSSLKFVQPQVSGEVQRWQQLLSGMMLKQMSSYYSGGSADGSYVGGSSSKTLHLCSDGSYAYAGSSSLGVDGGGGSSGYSGGSGEDYGRWRVEVIGARVTLVLQSQDGSSAMYGITMNEKGETYLDGERTYRVQSDRCR